MEVKRVRVVFTLGLPIIGGMVSQSILNVVDTAMVGSLGDAALAAVGLGGFVAFMCQSMVMGLAAGVQAMSSRRHGEGEGSEMALPLNAGLVLAVGAGIPMSIVLYFLAPYLFTFLNSDPAVQANGIPYLEMRMIAIAAVGVNFSFRGYWNGVSRSKMYMKSLLLMHITNITFNYCFIYGHFGFDPMGVKGSGLGTSLSMIVGSLYYMYLGYREARPNGFLRVWPNAQDRNKLLKIAIPNGLQSLSFAAGFTVLYWVIGQVGTAELAAANVIINISLVCILPGIALGLATASLVGQAMGRNDLDDARQWGWDVAKVGVVTLGTLGLPLLLVPDIILGFFINNSATAQIAELPLRLAGLAIAFEGVGLVLLQAQIGAGETKGVLIISTVIQWIVFLPIAYYVGPVLGMGLTGVWVCQVGYRAIFACSMVAMWNRGAWSKISV